MPLYLFNFQRQKKIGKSDIISLADQSPLRWKFEY